MQDNRSIWCVHTHTHTHRSTTHRQDFVLQSAVQCSQLPQLHALVLIEGIVIGLQQHVHHGVSRVHLHSQMHVHALICLRKLSHAAPESRSVKKVGSACAVLGAKACYTFGFGGTWAPVQKGHMKFGRQGSSEAHWAIYCKPGKQGHRPDY
eukprot:979390-Pelagomonas_calceolata.AAC.3